MPEIGGLESLLSVLKFNVVLWLSIDLKRSKYDCDKTFSAKSNVSKLIYLYTAPSAKADFYYSSKVPLADKVEKPYGV